MQPQCRELFISADSSTIDSSRDKLITFAFDGPAKMIYLIPFLFSS